MIQEQVPSAVCSVRAFVHMRVYGYVAVSVTVRERVFLECTSACTYIYIFAHVDALVCLAKRSDVCLVPSLEWLEEQRTPGCARPEGILLRAERN